jgi:hypothetical protein
MALLTTMNSARVQAARPTRFGKGRSIVDAPTIV